MTIPFTITPLTTGDTAAIEQLAAFLPDAFLGMAPDYLPTVEAALAEIRSQLQPENVELIARDASGVIAWIGGIPAYDGHVFELHPLAVRPDRQRQGVGQALVAALEAEAAARGASTIFLGSDDQMNMTSVGGVDLYPHPLEYLAAIEDRAGHPYRFYQRCGFVLVGILPDANGPGKPDLFLAKRVRPLRGGQSSAADVG